MNKSFPTRAMREHPDLEQLKRQSKELLEAFRAGDASARAEVAAHYRNADPTTFALHDAQLVLARACGFQSWPTLKAYVEGVTVKAFKGAVCAGDLEQVRSMLRLRPELVNMNLSGYDDRALNHAVCHRRPEMVRLLIENGAETRVGGALTMATERGYDEIVAIIRESQALQPEDPQPSTKSDLPALPPELSAAFRIGDEDRALAILAAEPVLIQSQRDGVTPLQAAAALLLERTARWLLDHGADVNARSKWRESPLDVAGCGRGWGRTSTPEKVTAMMDLLLVYGAQRTARWAIATGNSEWLRARRAEGALDAGEGLLSQAVNYDRPEIVALLLDLGFDPDERRRLDLEPAEDSWGQPLRNCAEHDKLAMAEMLLARGGDPNAHIYASGTPLFVAYRKKNAAMIELMERYGGYLDAEMVGWLGLTDKAKQMLADEAAGVLRPQAIPDSAAGQPVAELLLIGGVNHPEILQLALPRIDRPRDDPWWDAKLDESCGRGDPACLRMLLERCDVGKCAPTILQRVAGDPWPVSQQFWPEEERVPKARMLLDAGARLDSRDEWSKSTPLGVACREGRIELVKLFLEHGADPVEADAGPWATPLAWAEKMKHADVLALLRDYQPRTAQE